MTNSFINDLVSDLNDDDTNIIEEGKAAAEFSGYIDTGSYILNAACSGSIFGGIPDNKIVALAGEEATGKTFFALSAVKQLLDQNKDAFVFYYDTESAVTRHMMRERGIDTNRVIVVEKNTIQEFRTHALDVLEKYAQTKPKDRPKMMMVLDSIGQLSSTKELEDTMEGKETRDMTKAQLLKATFRVLNLKLAKLTVPCIVTNHVYDVIGSYIPMKEMAGGSGLKYTASQIIFLSKRKEKEGKEVIGNIIKCKMMKSRISRENTLVEVKLDYMKGLDRYYGLLELGERHGIFKKVSTRYEMPDGRKMYGKQIMKEPEEHFTQDILEQLDEAAHKEFTYGGFSDTMEQQEEEDNELNELTDNEKE